MPSPEVPHEARYAVVVCPRCRHAKGVDRTAKTTTCGRCQARHVTEGLRHLYTTEDPERLRVAVGLVEAKVTGGEAALLDVQALHAEIQGRRERPSSRIMGPATDSDDLVQYAASLAAGVQSVAKKVDRIFTALDEGRPDGWTQDEAESAFVAARLPRERAEKEIRRALVQDEVYEPRPGHLKRLG